MTMAGVRVAKSHVDSGGTTPMAVWPMSMLITKKVLRDVTGCGHVGRLIADRSVGRGSAYTNV